MDWKSAETYATAEVEDYEDRTLMLIAGYGAPFAVTCPPLRLFFSCLY